MANQRRPEALCRNFCSYYKPEKKEELVCRGAIVVQGLLHLRQFSFERTASQPSRNAAAEIVKRVCAVCDFRIAGCDFAADGRSVPCGGFLFLAQLMAQGTITAEDLD